MNKHHIGKMDGSGDALAATLAQTRLKEAARRKGCNVMVEVQFPAWMQERSLLPKRPPGQS